MEMTGVRLFDGRGFSDGCSISVDGERVRHVECSGGANTADALVMPGLIDAHVHLHQIALFLGEAELQEVRDSAELIARLRAPGRGGWVLGNRLGHLQWRSRATSLKELLDSHFPVTPVRLLFSDGHSGLLNETGLQQILAWRMAGHLTDLHLATDAQGKPTGLATDGNLELATLMPPQHRLSVVGKDHLAAAATECARHGITTVHDLFVTVPEYLVLREAELEGLRIYSYINFQQLDELLRLKHELGPELETERLRVQGIKCFADGSLGSEGGLLTRPYLNDPDNCGFEVLSTTEIAELAHRCLAHGLQLSVHALGDRGVANVLDAFERALADCGQPVDHRFRIEHAEMIREEDIGRCRRLSVVLSMQPYHFTDDARWLPQRVPTELCRKVSRWKSLVDAGNTVCFGSDAPFTNIAAVDGIRSAIHRLETLAPEHRAYFADEALTPAQALSCYSSGAAYAVFEEENLGTIAPGRAADLTVLDLGLERVLMTVVAGRITWLGDEVQAFLT